MVDDPVMCWGRSMALPPSLPELEVRDVNHLGLLSQLWDDLGFGAVIDHCIPSDDVPVR